MAILLPKTTDPITVDRTDKYYFGYTTDGNRLSTRISEAIDTGETLPYNFENKVFPDIYAPIVLLAAYSKLYKPDDIDYSNLFIEGADLAGHNANDLITAEQVIYWRAMLAFLMLSKQNKVNVKLEKVYIHHPGGGDVPENANSLLDPFREFTPKAFPIIQDFVIEKGKDVYLFYIETADKKKVYLALGSPYTVIAPLHDAFDYIAKNYSWAKWISTDVATKNTVVTDPTACINGDNNKALTPADAAMLAIAVNTYYANIQTNYVAQTTNNSRLRESARNALILLFTKFVSDLDKRRDTTVCTSAVSFNNEDETWHPSMIFPKLVLDPGRQMYKKLASEDGNVYYFADDKSSADVTGYAIMVRDRAKSVSELRAMNTEDRKRLCHLNNTVLLSDFFLISDYCEIFYLGDEDKRASDWQMFSQNILSTESADGGKRFYLVPSPIVSYKNISPIEPSIKLIDENNGEESQLLVDVSFKLAFEGIKEEFRSRLNAKVSKYIFRDVAMWPSHKIEGVNKYIIFTSPTADDERDHIYITLSSTQPVLTDNDKHFGPAENELDQRHYFETETPPETLYVYKRDGDSGVLIGSLSVVQKTMATEKIATSGSVAHYAIDFGTSSTTIRWIDSQKNDSHPFNEKKADGKCINDPAMFAAMDKTIIDKYFIPDGVPASFQTMLLECREKNEDGVDYKAFDPKLFGDANVFFRSFLGKKYLKIDTMVERVESHMKWNDDELSREFLKQLIAMSLVEAKANGFDSVQFTFTFPLSLSQKHRHKYHKCITVAFDTLKTEYSYFGVTDVKFDDKTVDESRAAAAFILVDPNCLRKKTGKLENFVSIDIGGGSADIYVYLINGADVSIKSASIKIGARQIINLFNGNDNKLFTRICKTLDIVDKKDASLGLQSSIIEDLEENVPEDAFDAEFEHLIMEKIGDKTVGEEFNRIRTYNDNTLRKSSIFRTAIALNLFCIAYYAGCVIKSMGCASDLVTRAKPLYAFLAGNGSKMFRWAGDDDFINKIVVAGISHPSGIEPDFIQMRNRTDNMFKHEAAAGANYLNSEHYKRHNKIDTNIKESKPEYVTNPAGITFKPNSSAPTYEAEREFTPYDYFFPKEFEITDKKGFEEIIKAFNGSVKDTLYSIALNDEDDKDMPNEVNSEEKRVYINYDELLINVERKTGYEKDRAMEKESTFSFDDLDAAETINKRDAFENNHGFTDADDEAARKDKYVALARNIKVRTAIQLMFDGILEVIEEDVKS